MYLFFLQCYVIPCFSKPSSFSTWKDEIENSVKRNIKGCPYHYIEQANSSYIISSDVFTVKRIFPFKHELRPFQELSSSLTKVHKDLAVTAALRGYNYEKWGKETESRWEIPSNHPGQNRLNCINMTQLASNGKIYAFYDSFKKVDRAFYLSIIKNGFIHPSGAVMSSCGYYQGEELCENRWDYAGKWNTDCKNTLKRMKLQWDNAFFPTDPEKVIKEKDYKNLINGCSDKTDLGSPGAENGQFLVTKEEKVFIISSLWDYNYHHFISDSLGRLARHYDFLKKHSDIKIHIRSFEEYDNMHRNNPDFKKSSQKMRNALFELLGFNTSRLVSGPVLAKEVYIPRALRCAYALSNPMELRVLVKHFYSNMKYFTKRHYPHLSKYLTVGSSFSSSTSSTSLNSQQQKRPSSAFFSKSNNGNRKLDEKSVVVSTNRLSSSHPNILTVLTESFIESTSIYWPSSLSSEFIQTNKQKEKNMIIMQRFHPVDTDRYWDDNTFAKLILSFAQAFPEHNIIPFSSQRLSNPDYCLACDILLMTQSDILVGAHGAGLTNMMFFPVGTMIVEIVGETKDVNMPVCGYYGPYAAIFGHHHYTYAFHFEKGWPLLAQQAADEASSFYQFLRKRKSDELIIPVYDSIVGVPYRP
jgi:hypothetical protein